MCIYMYIYIYIYSQVWKESAPQGPAAAHAPGLRVPRAPNINKTMNMCIYIYIEQHNISTKQTKQTKHQTQATIYIYIYACVYIYIYIYIHI